MPLAKDEPLPAIETPAACAGAEMIRPATIARAETTVVILLRIFLLGVVLSSRSRWVQYWKLRETNSHLFVLTRRMSG